MDEANGAYASAVLWILSNVPPASPVLAGDTPSRRSQANLRIV
jgi:hypothetical protein